MLKKCVAVVTVSQLLPCRSCYHVAVVTVSQLLPCRSCYHVAVVTMSQLLPCRSCYRVAVVVHYIFWFKRICALNCLKTQ